VVEETDETQFWLELIEEANLLDKSLYSAIKDEANELIKIFTATKHKMKK
jgi:four helix bundle protein